MEGQPLRNVRNISAARYRDWAIFVFALIVALGINRWIQASAGANAAWFGSYPDEPSHFVSGLMVRDYLTTAFGSNPHSFAAQYYLHLPFFAVGYWPPFFYTVEALWMLIFGVGWNQAMWLGAIVSALVAATIFWQARRIAGTAIAVCAGLIFLFWPASQWSACAVMTDTSVALFGLWAGIAFASYLQRPRYRAAILFALCATMAIMTKYSGLFVALIPLPAIILLRRWDILRKLSFWIQPVIVAALWFPWLLATKRYMMHGFGFNSEDTGGIATMFMRCLTYLSFHSGPPIGLLLLGIWLFAAFRWRHLRERELVWMIMVPAVLLFIAIAAVPVETRYLVLALPPLLLLAASMARNLIDTIALRNSRAAVAVSAVMLASVLAYLAGVALRFPFPTPSDNQRVAEFILNAPGIRNASILVPASREGPMIATIATLDPKRAERILERPNKLFAYIDWNKTTYRPYANSAAELEAFFEANPVDIAIIRSGLDESALPHERLISEMVKQYPERWRLLREFPDGSGTYRVYQFARPAKWGELTPDFVARMTRFGDVTADIPAVQGKR